MNPDKQKALAELTRRGPFWACFLVFTVLACDYGFRLSNLLGQRDQLNTAMLNQARNAGTLTQAQELERRLEAFSLDLLQAAKTNANAKQIIQEFNIQWTPGPAATSAPPAAIPQPK
jgi:hypothetical protein